MMKTKTQARTKRVGIRKNLLTYFTVRFIQGLALTITLFFYMNSQGNNPISWWLLPVVLPSCIILTTYVLEMIPHFIPSNKKG